MDVASVVINLSLLLFLSALFSGAETAFTSISPSKAEVLRKEKGALSRVTVFLYDRLDMVITLNLIISNLVNIVISSYITFIAVSIFDGAKAFTYAVSTGTILILVFGEILPKKLAILFPVKFSKFAAYILYCLYYLLHPIVIPVSKGMHIFDRWAKKNDTQPEISEEEVGAMLDLGKKEGAIESQEHEMIKNIFLLNDKEVRDIMTRRDDIVAIAENATIREFLELSAQENLSRIPVYTEDISHIDWIISIPQLTPFLTNPKILDKKIKDFHSQKAFKIPESKILDDLFYEFQKKRVHLAIVLDEFGKTSGLVTLEDIVEEIFGDIEDETDQVEVRITETASGDIFVDGNTNVNQILKFLKASDAHYNQNFPLDKTISGVILDTLHRFPKEGEDIILPDLPFRAVITDMNDECIHKVQILPKQTAS
jgi:CBS domain containing-hemolysin-like protein